MHQLRIEADSCSRCPTRAVEADSAALAVAISEGSPAPVSAAKATRLAQIEASDSVESAHGALRHLRDDLSDLEAEATISSDQVHAAINQILADAAVPLIEDLEKIKREIVTLQAALRFVRYRAFKPMGTGAVEVAAWSQPLKAITPRIVDATEVNVRYDVAVLEHHPAAQRWARFAAELASDPDLPVPEH